MFGLEILRRFITCEDKRRSVSVAGDNKVNEEKRADIKLLAFPITRLKVTLREIVCIVKM
ncbi:hypothetical protein GCM10007216_13160 [Thalassobacillus devorans]|uniref:Uncharacterized protein n=1 Tax=Thalassobacillus devorans TaxID=279813 RepID=A0ABQ1NSI1_9BACI|nr:hypothetical protein GCM10007216_13160 [Thalassobacillus devorans]